MKYPTIEVPATFDDKAPHGKRAGDNKFRTATCPFCGSYGHALYDPEVDDIPILIFAFRDLLSAREYEISGMCQKCQDETFKECENESN
jgi:hypothetical protein